MHLAVQRFDQEKPAADPALVTHEPLGDGGLRQPVIAVQRAHDPPLLELGEPAPDVQRRDLHRGLHDVGRAAPDADLAPTEPAGGVQALESVDDLEPLTARERQRGRQLAVARQRHLHRGHRVRLAQTQPPELLAELAESDALLRG